MCVSVCFNHSYLFRVHVVLRELTVVLVLSCCSLVFSTDCPMSPWNIDALVSLQRDLKLKVLMSTGLSDKLQKAAGGFLSATEEQQVREQHGDSKQMGKLIEILKGKQDKDFKTFLKMLQDTNHQVWADELEKRAEMFKTARCKCSFCCYSNYASQSNPPVKQFLYNCI